MKRILFVTSNGTGVGHLTRSMAIAKRLGEGFEPWFVTLSAAAPVVRDLGFPVEYVASYDRPGAGTDIAWTYRTRERLRAIVREIEPSAVLFDGTHPYERLLPALRASGAPLAWCRRAMWRAGADTSALWRSHLFDAILEPGELAADSDRGPTVARRAEAERVEPVVLPGRSELLPRERAAAELGLDPSAVNVLVALGQGEGVRAAAARSLDLLAGADGVQPVAMEGMLAELGDVPGGVRSLAATYPIARYFRAFDGAVSAAGYNAFHELVGLGVPTLFVPIERQTDDQHARARGAERAGLALACGGAGDPALPERLLELADGERRASLARALAALPEWLGAAEGARFAERLAGEPRAETEASGGGGPALGLRARRGWIFVSSVPRTVARVTGQRLRRPRLRTMVLAFGLDAEQLERELVATLERLGERPERTLVVSDLLDYSALLRLGAGFEHVPGPDEPHAGRAGLDWDAFKRARLALIAARRPRPRRTVDLAEPGVPGE